MIRFHSNPSDESTGRTAPWRNYVLALLVLTACNALAWVCYGILDLTNILMIYLIGILAVVSFAGKGPSTLTCVLGVLSFDFFMVPPRFAFAHSDTQYLITLGVVLLFTLAISELMDRVRRQAAAIREARLQAETEQLRSALLSSVSHDLRTPLAVITGSASSLLDPSGHLGPEARRELAQDIYSQSERLNRFLSNLLEMTRLSAGKVGLKKEIQPLEEVVGAALSRMEKKLEGHSVTANLPEDLPMLPLDSLLMEQVFINLLENCLKYTPEDSTIGISALVRENTLTASVWDSGPGLKKGDEEKIFNKFYRSDPDSAQGGMGLGLAICRAVVEAHGGRIWAQNRPAGGACISFTIPVTQGAAAPGPA